MKTFIKDLIHFDAKYKHIPLIVFCVLYLFSPIDLLPEFPIKYWYSYIDDISVLIATGIIVYIDKGGVLYVQNRAEKSNNNTITRNNSTNTDNTSSVEVDSNINCTSSINNNSSKYNISSDRLAGNIEEGEEQGGVYSEVGRSPRNTNDYITELKQKSRDGGLIVQSKSSCW